MKFSFDYLKTFQDLECWHKFSLPTHFIVFLFIGTILVLICQIIYVRFQKWNCLCGVLPNLIKAIEENNNITAIKLIQRDPCSINKIINNQGYTPFLLASLKGNTQLVKFMLSQGADISSHTTRKENSFYLAVYNLLKNKSNKDASCLHTLFHAGVDINMPNNKGYNALQMAAVFGHVPLIKWLHSKNTNFEVIPDPCILAHMEGHQEAAKVILNYKRQSICL